MTEVSGLSANAELGIKINEFLKGINTAIDKLSEFSGENRNSLNSVEKLEKALAELAKTTQQLSKDIGNGTQATKQDSKARKESLELKEKLIAADRAASRSAETEARARRDSSNDIAKAEAKAHADFLRREDERYSRMASTRYALYDVAATWGIVATATLGAEVAALKVYAAYDKAMAQIQRTSGLDDTGFGQLQKGIDDLFTAIPVSMDSIGSIATLAGQLGIAGTAIDDFTEVVAKFEASTDVTAEAAAEGIGRTAQLTKTAASEYANLAASIYQTGVTSVATESQILSTLTQIATAGDLAGFANHEIVALASSFASLGVAPERARGSVQRIFGEITESVNTGGESVANFARVSSMSVEEFSKSWREDPQVAFSAFVKGLGDMGKAGEDTNAMLKDMGIGAVRDIQALQALGNNHEVYAKALVETSTAYANGTALNEGYAQATDNLADKFALMTNNLKMLVINSQQFTGPVLGAMLDALTHTLGALNKFAAHPVGGTLLGIATAAVVLVGGLAAVRATTALVQASFLGLQQVQYQLNRTQALGTATVRDLVGEMGRMLLMKQGDARASASQAAAQRGANAAQLEGAKSTAALGTAQAATGTKSAGLLRSLGGIGSTLLKGGLWGAGITAALWGLGALADQFRSAEDKAEDFLGSYEGLAEAMQADSAADYSGKVFGKLSVDLETNTDKSRENKIAYESALGTYKQTAEVVEGVKESVEGLSVTLGENTQKWLLNKLTSGETGEQMTEWYAKYGEAVKGVEGFDLQRAFESTLDPAVNAAELYTNQLEGIKTRIEELETKSYTPKGITEDERVELGNLNDQLFGLNELHKVLGSVQVAFGETSQQSEMFKAFAGALGVELDETANSADNAATELGAVAQAIADYASTTAGSVQSQYAMQDSLYGLGQSLYANGSAFDAFSENGRANMSALQSTVSAIAAYAGEDSAVFTQHMIGLINTLSQYGVNVGQDLGFLYDMLNQVNGTQAYSEIYVDTTAAQENIIALEARAAILEAKLSTLSYANNLRVDGLDPNYVLVQAQLADINLQRITQEKALAAQTAQTAVQAESVMSGYHGAAQQAANTASNAGKVADNTEKAADAAKDLEEEFRTVSDWANEISGVLDRAFEIEFSVQEAEDNLAKQYMELEQWFADAGLAADEARRRIAEFNAEIGTIKADNSVLEWKLRIALNHGDTKRAEELQAQINENNSDIADLESDKASAAKDLAAAEDILSASLEGATAASIEFRDRVREIVTANNALVVAMADTGFKQKDINSYINSTLVPTFKKELDQVGANKEEYKKYTTQVKNAKTAINEIPRNVTKSVDIEVGGKDDVDGMQAAIKEFKDKEISLTAKSKMDTTKTKDWRAKNTGGKGLSKPIKVPIVTSHDGGGYAAEKQKRLNAYMEASAKYQAALNPYNPKLAESRKKTMGAKYNEYINYWTGGYTGRGGKYEEAGMVHKGEYVIPKEGVNQTTGLPDMNYLMQQLPRINSNTYSNYITNSRMTEAIARNVQLVEIVHNQYRGIVQGSSGPAQVILDMSSVNNSLSAMNTNSNSRNSA